MRAANRKRRQRCGGDLISLAAFVAQQDSFDLNRSAS